MSIVRFTAETLKTAFPPTDKYYLGIDSADGRLYVMDDAGVVTKFASSSSSIPTGTTVEMLASSPSVADQWYNTDNLKLWTYSDKSLWYVVGETMIVNKQSGTFEVGELVIPDSTLTTGVEIASTSATNEIVGVNVWQVNTELFCVVAYAGIWDVLCSDDNTYSVGEFLVHDGSPTAEDGQAKRRSSGNGHMAICLEAGTVPAGGGLLKCQIQTTERY